MDGIPVPLASPATPETFKSLPYTKLYKAPRCRPTTSQSWEQLDSPSTKLEGFQVLKTGSLAQRVGKTSLPGNFETLWGRNSRRHGSKNG